MVFLLTTWSLQIKLIILLLKVDCFLQNTRPGFLPWFVPYSFFKWRKFLITFQGLFNPMAILAILRPSAQLEVIEVFSSVVSTVPCPIWSYLFLNVSNEENGVYLTNTEE